MPMPDVYRYRTLRTERAAWPRVAASVAGLPSGSVFGLWMGQIGFASNEGVLITVGAGTDDPRLDGVLESSVVELEPTVRPAGPTPPTDPGVYAHRWFEVNAPDVPEFLQLSQDGWVDFESMHNTRIIGLWRDAGTADPTRLLLLTWYASLLDWERSRPLGGRPDGADPEQWERARRAFGRRAELTRWSVVRTTTLARPR